MHNQYTIKDFVSLIIIFAIIVGLTLMTQLLYGWNINSAMYYFMGFFFIIFGAFKLMNLAGFVEAYRTYDILAQKSIAYAYAYPFIELSLGILYLTRSFPTFTNIITLIIMIISSIGVIRELLKKREIACACLGVVFKIPMTWVTLFEDLLIATMAAFMLFHE